MPSLTSAEATRRAALLRVDSYHVELDLTRGDEVFGSTTTIRFRAQSPEVTFVDVTPRTLHAATLNGVPLDVAGFDGDRLALREPSAENVLVIEATMAYTRSGTGLHRFVDPADGQAYLYAGMFVDNAPAVFACFDQPDLKAPLTLTVTADPQWTVVANGAGRQTAPGRWEFTETAPLATYFVGLAAGPYHGVHSEHDGVPMSLYARRSLAEHLDRDAPEIFEITRACLDRYHEMFAVRYPFGKYDQVFAPEFTMGAMENPGIVTFRDEYVFRSAATEAQHERRAAVIAHEMAHMWFGDLVTLRWWDDVWLNESFAEYMGSRVIAEATPYTDAWTSFATGRKAWGYAADQRPSTHPVVGEVPDTASTLLLFDGICYAKGASVLRQLVAWLGDEAFLAGLRDYFARHRHGNATLADLLAALGRASGRDLSAWARLWLTTSGVNTLSLDGGVIVQDGTPSRPHRIGVGRYDRSGARLDRIEVDIDGPGTAIELAPADLVLLNDGDLSYAKIRLTDWPAVIDLLPRITDSLTRALLWQAVWGAVRDAVLPAGFYLRLVAAGLPAETRVTVVEHVLDNAWHAATQYLPASGRVDALAGIYEVCRSMLTRDPERRLAFAQGAARFAPPGDSAVVATLRGWLAVERTDFGVPVDPELRWQIAYRLAALGELDAADIDAEYERDHSGTGAEQAARCRAARPDPDAKAAAWQTVVADETLSQRLLFASADGFWQPGQEALTQTYIGRYAGQMPEMATRRHPQVVSRLADLAYPRYAVAPETLDTMRRLLTRDDLTPMLRRAVVDATDELARSLASRGR
ncbi:aminopeptidase N [Rugosimonospora africana]|uniref:Aminopeptidase N n=1 Tax=Rugosimonospora africana TaxID=556532 RepID=A0A8J3R235_9ACTN|nr:aminopeptidase N [Rugosimonospora africana]GIH19970.1 aminopeptidase [Rugosimonospora africana]